MCGGEGNLNLSLPALFCLSLQPCISPSSGSLHPAWACDLVLRLNSCELPPCILHLHSSVIPVGLLASPKLTVLATVQPSPAYVCSSSLEPTSMALEPSQVLVPAWMRCPHVVTLLANYPLCLWQCCGTMFEGH